MPKPAVVESNLRTWLHDERQDTLTAFTRVITTSVVNTGTSVHSSISVADIGLPIAALGRNIGDMWGVIGHARALAMSPESFRVLRLSGWKQRAKDVEAEADLDDVVVHHLDHDSQSGHPIRYFVIDLPDGRWLADSLVQIKNDGSPARYAHLSDAFIAAQGPRARPIVAATG